MAVLAGAETCQVAVPAAGACVALSTAAITPPDAVQFSVIFAGCEPPVTPAQPPVPAACPEQVTTVYSAPTAEGATARAATMMRSWTLLRTVARTPGRRWSSAPGSGADDARNGRASN